MDAMVKAQSQYGDEDEVLRKALELSLLEEGNFREEQKYDDREMYNLFGIDAEYERPPSENRNRQEIRPEPRRNNSRRNDPALNNQDRLVDDLDSYVLDGDFNNLLAQTQAEYRASLRHRNERHQFDYREQEQPVNNQHRNERNQRDHRDRSYNNLLADMPDLVYQRIRNPATELVSGGGGRRDRHVPYSQFISYDVPDNFLRARFRTTNYRLSHNRPRNHQVPESMNYEELLEWENRMGKVSRGYKKEEIDEIPICY